MFMRIKNQFISKYTTKIRNERGMTLVEIMIVLVILGGLASVLASVVVGRLRSARIRQAKLQISEIGKLLDQFNAECNFYPTTEQGLEALVHAPTQEPTCANWGPDPYIKKTPKDPWGHPFIYENQGGSYVLKSLGSDNREGGAGESADISSENL